jgi:ribosome-binding protein aMBF1 (putative translation factor)
MARTTLNEMKTRRLEQMSTAERGEFDAAYAATKLALEVGEQVRDARENAGLTQRELAARMGTSQAAIARLEAGGVGATLTTLQKVATALELEVSVLLRPAS